MASITPAVVSRDDRCGIEDRSERNERIALLARHRPHASVLHIFSLHTCASSRVCIFIAERGDVLRMNDILFCNVHSRHTLCRLPPNRRPLCIVKLQPAKTKCERLHGGKWVLRRLHEPVRGAGLPEEVSARLSVIPLSKERCLREARQRRPGVMIPLAHYQGGCWCSGKQSRTKTVSHVMLCFSISTSLLADMGTRNPCRRPESPSLSEA